MPSKNGKTRKRSTRRVRKSARKTKKVYGADKIIPYNIHKVTLISYDPKKSCQAIRNMFGGVVSKIQTPPDKALAERGIKWVRFLKGGKAEFHFVPPFSLKHHRTLVNIVAEEDKGAPLASQFYENHAGIYVPDLTPVVLNAKKHKINCHLNKRADGMYQFYVNIPGALDYLDIDSLNFDFKVVQKKYPDFRVYGFDDNKKIVERMQKDHDNNTLTHAYIDPVHDGAPRIIYLKRNGNLTITGRDQPHAKLWKIKGKIDTKGNATLNFKPKGGPANVKAKIRPDKVTFSDGNVWKGLDRKLYNLL